MEINEVIDRLVKVQDIIGDKAVFSSIYKAVFFNFYNEDLAIHMDFPFTVKRFEYEVKTNILMDLVINQSIVIMIYSIDVNINEILKKYDQICKFGDYELIMLANITKSLKFKDSFFIHKN